MKTNANSGTRALAALVAGAAIATVAVTAVLLHDGDAAGADAPAPTATPRSQTVDEALAAFVLEQFGEAYIDACPQDGSQVQGVCSVDIERSASTVRVALGHPYSEGIGTATLARQADGTWSVDFDEGTGAGAP